jgi:hypothetical protein
MLFYVQFELDTNNLTLPYQIESTPCNPPFKSHGIQIEAQNPN